MKQKRLKKREMKFFLSLTNEERELLMQKHFGRLDFSDADSFFKSYFKK